MVKKFAGNFERHPGLAHSVASIQRDNGLFTISHRDGGAQITDRVAVGPKMLVEEYWSDGSWDLLVD